MNKACFLLAMFQKGQDLRAELHKKDIHSNKNIFGSREWKYQNPWEVFIVLAIVLDLVNINS